MIEDDEVKMEKPKKKAVRKALKDFHIFCPPKHDIKIEKGDDISDVPEMFMPNLKTEGVI